MQASPNASLNERRRKGMIALRSVSEDLNNTVDVSAVVLMDTFLARQK